jgi:outer membrane protein OmpA-like peptidoglycan-associated protein
MSLYDGFETHVGRDGWYGATGDSTVAVTISGVNLRPLYERFIDCFRGVLTMSWAEVERTRVGYSENIWQIDEASRKRLETLAAYVLADRWVAVIFVDGHTDTTGGQNDNTRLSKRRAEQVAEILTNAGVAAKLITVRYHGAAYLVADNEIAAGRARNRRTTVRLERDLPKLAVSSEPISPSASVPAEPHQLAQ